jgi:hypothetical protein
LSATSNKNDGIANLFWAISFATYRKLQKGESKTNPRITGSFYYVVLLGITIEFFRDWIALTGYFSKRRERGLKRG